MGKRLILVADGLGITEATTSAGFLAIQSGLATSGRLHVVGAWAREVARHYHNEDLGVGLVLTSPHPVLGYRPLTYAPTLMGGAGTFPTTVEDLLEHAEATEVYHELRAQLERAILWGLTISHITVFEDCVWPRADLADTVFALAEEFDVALRIEPAYDEEHLGYDAYALARQRGITTVDRTLPVEGDIITSIAQLFDVLEGELRLKTASVTELSVTFGTNTSELHAYGTKTILVIDPVDLLSQASQLNQLLTALDYSLDGYRGIASSGTIDLMH
ncbi:ChbG/HpnK family deacetylase [Ferrimicrobium sp.]|uniref:ChbG/HpnK family deacetylase n=1 Tax=Ferrimicrobium sp. TaxID=2926050 RepID=UPI002619C9FD|nr:ChbG/HpnK family deacetylase [Ferrimicrobium sp.]